MGMSPRLLRPRQTGFNPKTIANLANWWDAADSSTVTLNGTTVQSWSNRSSGPALAQETAGAQPTYTAAGVNGRNVLTFDGGDVLSASASYGTQLSTIFMVFRENLASNFGGFLAFTPASGNDNSNNNAILVESALNESLIVVQRSTSGQLASFLGSGVLPLSVMTVRAQAVGLLLRTNGTVRQNNTGNSTSGTSTGVVLGGRFQSGAISGSFRANMTVCEILHYTASLSDAEIARIERYLGQKWGITVA